jgi:glycosyltransferase involved in cell wall biosynthesis
MNGTATVAVIIPAYNCEDFIVEALDSIARQTEIPDEVVVVDDGSTDRTAELVSAFNSKSALRIILIRQSNQGIAAARNAGIARCSSNWIALLDGDDIFYPSFIEKAKQALLTHPELIACFSDRDVVDGEGEFMRRDLDEPRFRALKAERLDDGVSVLRESPFITLVSGNVIPIGNLMFSRENYDKAGGFDAELRAVEDKPFLLRLAKLGTFGFIDEPLGIWRRHNANTSGSGNNFKMNWYSELGAIKLEAQADALGLDRAEREAIRRQRQRMPARLLYSASASANPAYLKLAVRLLMQGRAGPLLIATSSARYAWRFFRVSFASGGAEGWKRFRDR